MKKQILITSAILISLSLMAFSLINRDEPTEIIETVESTPPRQTFASCNSGANLNYVSTQYRAKRYSNFFYDLSAGFEPIKKSEIKKMNSVNDFLSKEDIQRIDRYQSTALILIIGEKQSEIREYGDSKKLNDAQLLLLNSLDYSSDFLMRTEFLEKNEATGEMASHHFGPHFTIVPEKQAIYLPGKESLLDYIKIQNKENTANLNEDKLQPAKLRFTVTKDGSIRDVGLDRTSGYIHIDQSMIRLISKAPGEWVPAENAQGEKVDQVLVISFGMVGC